MTGSVINEELFEAHPRDVIIQYILKPTFGKMLNAFFYVVIFTHRCAGC